MKLQRGDDAKAETEQRGMRELEWMCWESSGGADDRNSCQLSLQTWQCLSISGDSEETFKNPEWARARSLPSPYR